MHGFQLWANLPSALKMTAPRYQDIAGGDIPEVTDDDGTQRPRSSAASSGASAARSTAIAADPRYLDVSVPPGVRKTLPVETYRSAFAYVFEGSGSFRDASEPARRADREGDRRPGGAGARADRQPLAVLFDTGDEVTVQAGDDGIRFLLVSGTPIEEPVAWYGPIVMNTQAELQHAVAELQGGTFIKHR